MKYFALGGLIILLLSGCTPTPSTPTEGAPHRASEPVPLDEARILAIARQAVATNDTWLDRAEFHFPEREADGSWSVLVERLPKVPGGHRLILIDKEGRVAAYIRGK